jgi:hypothetical protein
MENIKYHIVETVPKPNRKIIEMKWSIKNVTVGTVEKSNRKIVEIGKIDTPSTQIHDRSLYWHGTRTSIKSGMVKQIHWPRPPLFMKWCVDTCE